MAAAYMLHQKHDITLYEKNDYIGGHSRTIDLNVSNNKTLPVDTGFIVFNKRNYPYLVKMFDRLNVPYEKSDMSFGASIADGWLEYGSKGVFSQKKNFLRPQYWGMLLDILKFNKQATGYLEKNKTATLQQCLDDLKMGDWFRRYYLQAMGAAIWSCSVETILKFPAASFIRFFDNHGLLTINDHPQWYTVTGGSREYIKRLTEGFSDKIKKQCGAVKVIRKDQKCTVTDSKGNITNYDQIIFACHADEALKLIKSPTEDEQKILGAFTYQKNHIVVHDDKSFMPKERGSWASWIYLSEKTEDDNESVSLTYWMNNLQNLDEKYPVFITLNPGRQPDKDKIYNEHDFTHPVFTTKAVAAQSKISDIQGTDKFWFCGAYQRYGFHEDGVLSAVNMIKSMGEVVPWE